MAAGTVFLMYHEVELPGRELCRPQRNYLRYVVTAASLRNQLKRLQATGFRGITVTEALREGPPKLPTVVMTFDDGCESDLLAAAPMLNATGFNGTFYVIAGFLGRRGYLSAAQLRELSDSGFEMGCHSMSHVYLTELDQSRLHAEIIEAKEKLEQVLGRSVDHFSCPGGQWNSRVAAFAQQAGYHSMAASRSGMNSGTTSPFHLARIAVLRGTKIDEFSRLCRGEGLLLRRCREDVLAVGKSLLGNSLYDRLRSATLGNSDVRSKGYC